MSYIDIQRDIEGAFALPLWTDSNVPTYPDSLPVDVNTEHVRININLGTGANFFGHDRLSGTVLIQVYIPTGMGPTRAYEICDLLDLVLKNQSFSNGTQSFASRVQRFGIDPNNSGLFRVNYSVPIRYYNTGNQ